MWEDILKIKNINIRPAKRDIYVLLVEAGFPSQYVRQLKVKQWGLGMQNILYQIPPNYLLDAAIDFNKWLDDEDEAARTGRSPRIKAATTDEESIEHIETLINQAIHTWEQSKLENAKTGRFEE